MRSPIQLYKNQESMKTMEKKLLIILAILLLVAGCSKEPDSLEDHKETLNASMKAYYQLEARKYEGDAFEAKVIDLVEVSHPYSADTNISFYRYRIVIAPKYNTATVLRSVRLDPADELIGAYLRGASPVGTGNIDTWNSVTSAFTFDKWEKLEDFSAYELSITFNNLTDTFMSEKKIEDAALKSALQNVELMIKYNDKVDTIVLDEIEIKSITSELLDSRDDLRELSSGGQTFDQFVPYE